MKPIKTRIRDAYEDPSLPGRDYWNLLSAVFPSDAFPNAWNYSSNGGPPGCAMAFGRALREMGGRIDFRGGRRHVYLPPEEK